MCWLSVQDFANTIYVTDYFDEYTVPLVVVDLKKVYTQLIARLQQVCMQGNRVYTNVLIALCR